MIKLTELLDQAIDRCASDLHLTCENLPLLRVEGKLMPFGKNKLTRDEVEKLVFSMIDGGLKKKLFTEKEIDFSYAYSIKGYFRVNVYFQKGKLACALRYIPSKIKTLKELGLPKNLEYFTSARQGFLLVCGPASHGKTTTAVALIDIINHTRQDHIITIEDPIEYVFTPDKCLIDQREVGVDTKSFPRALRSALRQDPDVIFVGEMRDLETISAAITLAETGHLVISTIHTNDAPQTIDRLVDIFPPYQQRQIRYQIANTILGIISQRLVSSIDGKRIPAVEIMKATPSVRNLIREGKTYQLKNVIQTSSKEGMISLEQSLAQLVNENKVAYDEVLPYVSDQEGFDILIEKNK